MPSNVNVTVLGNPDAPIALPTLFKALGDALRVKILRVLKEGSLSVTELCDVFQLGQSALSHHLKVMTTANLLTRRREGTVIFYRRQLPGGKQAGLVSETLRYIDVEPLGEELAAGLARVQANREQNSLAFFQHNSERFHEHQELIASWDDYSQATLHLLDRHVESTRPRILEVGPGDGALLQALAARGASVVALDNSEAMLEKARVRAGHLSNIEFVLGEAGTLKRGDTGFDAIVINMVLHHTPDPQNTLKEIASLVNLTGVLIVSELCSHDQDWARAACGDLWLGFEPTELTDWAGRAELTGRAELFIAQRNGFQVQVRLFQKTRINNIKEPNHE